ncbi:hypothetical protein Q7P37_007624 [Cladosporium fusiforme]
MRSEIDALCTGSSCDDAPASASSCNRALRVAAFEASKLTIQGDDYDVYDGPHSPAKRLKKNNGSWRPWDVSQETSASGNTIRVSTPDRRTELFDTRVSHQPTKQQATPRQKTIYLSLIHDALRTKPDEPSSLEDILNWIRTNRSAVYQEYGAKKLRSAIQTSLSYQAKKVESKRTVWAYEGGTWQLHKAVAAVADDEQSADTYTERDVCTPSILVPSMGGAARNGTLESLEDTPPSTGRQTSERYNANGQNSPPAIVPSKPKSRVASIESQPNRPSLEADAETENEELASNGAASSEPTAVGHSLKHNEALTQADPTAGGISMTPNNEPCNTEESRVPANSCDDPKQCGQDEPDYAQIVRDLHRLKQERQMQEQQIEARRNSLPSVSTLTQSAKEAQCAADEAQRVADEAQRAAQTAKKAVEDAQTKQSQLAADQHRLKKLTEESLFLRAQLDID